MHSTQVRCHNCAQLIEVTSQQRPLTVECPYCGARGLFADTPMSAPQGYQAPAPSSPPPAPYPAYPPYSPYAAPSPYYYYGYRPRDEKYSMVAGVMLLIAFVVSLGYAVYFSFMFLFMMGGVSSPMTFPLAFIWVVCPMVFLISPIFALIGGIYALQRRKWSIALVGAILSIYTLFGIIALIFLILGREEFR